MADLTPATPWPYRADLPQRFTVNMARYHARGGTADPAADIRGYASGGDTGDSARFLAFTLAFDQIAKEHVAGDVAELGVYRGFTAHALALFARRLGRRTYLFDTFEGFDPADLTGLDQGAKATGFKDTSLDAVRGFVGTEATTYCPGHFPGTAKMVPDGAQFCLAHLDCDLYAPMLSALQFFYPRMAPGGFILMHDYSSLAWEGAESAADEFFADKPECLVPMPDNCGTAIVRRQRVADGVTWRDRQAAAAFGASWVLAGRRAADPLFADGWSRAEEWGRWGVGSSHTLRLMPPSGAAGAITLELDAQAVIMGAQATQDVAVSVGRHVAGVLRFSAEQNRGARTVRIPAEAWAGARDAQGAFPVTFLPTSWRSPAALSPGDRDDRPLGMAVHRLCARMEASIDDNASPRSSQATGRRSGEP